MFEEKLQRFACRPRAQADAMRSTAAACDIALGSSGLKLVLQLQKVDVDVGVSGGSRIDRRTDGHWSVGKAKGVLSPPTCMHDCAWRHVSSSVGDRMRVADSRLSARPLGSISGVWPKTIGVNERAYMHGTAHRTPNGMDDTPRWSRLCAFVARARACSRRGK